MPTRPAYFITFTCYGHIVHGDAPYSIDRAHNGYHCPPVPPSARRAGYQRALMHEPRYSLDQPRREAVIAAIRDVAAHRGWFLHAAHARSTHVHVVIDAPDCRPEQVMNQLKSYATRRLQQLPHEPARIHRWARHGSTRYLWTLDSLVAAIHYVVHCQGEPLACFQADLSVPAAP